MTLKILSDEDKEKSRASFFPIGINLSSLENRKTIYGKPKWFNYGKENRIKITLDCDENTLEFHLVKEEKPFWKVKGELCIFFGYISMRRDVLS